jgi:hypothetical protein
LKAEVGDDAFDAARGDGEAGLAEFLGDDVGGGVGVEEAMANDLTHDLVGADMRGFGTGLAELEGLGAMFTKGVEQLIISRFAEPILFGRGRGAEAPALTLIKHEEAREKLIMGRDWEFAVRTDDAGLWEEELHGRVSWPGVKRQGRG